MGGLGVVSTRGEGLLTTASDERSGKPAHSRRLAPHPLEPRVFGTPRSARASGVNNPAIQRVPSLCQSLSGPSEPYARARQARAANVRAVKRRNMRSARPWNAPWRLPGRLRRGAFLSGPKAGPFTLRLIEAFRRPRRLGRGLLHRSAPAAAR